MKRDLETLRTNIARPLSRVPPLMEKITRDDIKRLDSLTDREKLQLAHSVLTEARRFLDQRRPRR